MKSEFLVHSLAMDESEMGWDYQDHENDDLVKGITLHDLIQEYLKELSSGINPMEKDWQDGIKWARREHGIQQHIRRIFENHLLSPGKFDHESELIFFSMCAYLNDRPVVVRCLKSIPYRQFLSSLYWSCIKNRLRKIKHYCESCNSFQNLQVHHPSYDFRGEEFIWFNFRKLVMLCSDCHAKHHGVAK